jgi:triacylglycerol lipase
MKRVLAIACCFPMLMMIECGGVAPSSATNDEAALGSGYTATHHPIVLLHGLLGFQSLLGAVDYYPGIVDALKTDGAQVFTVHASQAADSMVRGAQIIPQLEAIRTATGASKLNLIGHSQGALDARFIAATRPDLVASVTSVHGPNQGSQVAEWALSLPLGLGPAAIQALSDLIKMTSGSSDPNDAKAALEFLRPSSIAAFNTAYPMGVPSTACGEGNAVDGGIYYFSWGGQGWLTNPVDILDPDWMMLGINVAEGNDGLVGRCSTHLGRVIRDDYLANHIDATNLMFGMVSPFGPSPVELFRVHANRMKGLGL